MQYNIPNMILKAGTNYEKMATGKNPSNNG